MGPTWVEKGKAKSLIVLMFLKAEIEQRWYFDSGSSQHMTGYKWLLSNVLPSSLDLVTFGDNAKGSVLGLGYLNVLGLPKLRYVLLVNGLKSNLINIIELCDQHLFMRFTKQKSIVLDQDKKQIMEGNRSLDNWYLLASLNTCLTSVQNDTNLWYRRMR